MAGIPVLVVSLLLMVAVIATRLWELESPLRLIPWVFGLVALIIAAMGAVFCIQGFLRRDNPALVIRKVRGELVTQRLVATLAERFQVEENELKVWPSLGYWSGIRHLTVKDGPGAKGGGDRNDNDNTEDQKADRQPKKETKERGAGKDEGYEGDEETGIEDGDAGLDDVPVEGSKFPQVNLEIKEIWVHRSQAHTSLSVLYGTQLALSVPKTGRGGMDMMNGVRLTRSLTLRQEILRHLESLLAELELEGRVTIR